MYVHSLVRAQEYTAPKKHCALEVRVWLHQEKYALEVRVWLSPSTKSVSKMTMTPRSEFKTSAITYEDAPPLLKIQHIVPLKGKQLQRP